MTTLAQPISLAQLKPGTSATICASDLHGEDASMVRAMGIRPSAMVRVCRNGRTCIVDVCDDCGSGCRIGLCHKLAQHVMVHPHS
ncbi:MAG: FeoA family protein [Planctomycetota bacterium]|jgi:Fe2+ transport system protein FeoA